MTDLTQSTTFDHPKNIQVGLARVIYAPYGFGAGEVWHLPGGAVTVDRDEAVAFAVRMDRIMGGAAQSKTVEWHPV
jgi:hypothetical protein